MIPNSVCEMAMNSIVSKNIWLSCDFCSPPAYSIWYMVSSPHDFFCYLPIFEKLTNCDLKSKIIHFQKCFTFNTWVLIAWFCFIKIFIAYLKIFCQVSQSLDKKFAHIQMCMCVRKCVTQNTIYYIMYTK